MIENIHLFIFLSREHVQVSKQGALTVHVEFDSGTVRTFKLIDYADD